jgi:hypothetical protein
MVYLNLSQAIPKNFLPFSLSFKSHVFGLCFYNISAIFRLVCTK